MDRSRQQLMYDEVVEDVAAHLKPRGFHKRGDRFGLRRGGNWGVIDFQKHSLATTRENVQFTINLGVWLRSLEDEPRDSAPAVGYCHWWDRISTEPPKEKWWIIDDESVPGFLPPLVSAAVESAIPILIEHLDDANIVSLYRSGQMSGLQLTRRHRERLDEMARAS